MIKIDNNTKQHINGGIAATTLFCLLGLGMGLINVIGAAISGAKNIQAASEQKIVPEKVFTNSVFTNNYSAKVY